MSSPPTTFRLYLLDGTHWRMSRRIASLKRGIGDGYTGPITRADRTGSHVTRVELAPAFVDHLDHAPEVLRAEDEARRRVVSCALDDIEEARGEDRAEGMRVLRFYMTPEYLRPRNVAGQATIMNMTERNLLYTRDRAVGWVWAVVDGDGWARLWA